MEIIDVGHRYKLHTLDGNFIQLLQFVKRKDKLGENKFPGNKTKYSGTTIQEVLRCLLNRVRYLNNQVPCVENELLMNNFQESLLLLEQRAAKRHGLILEVNSLEDLEMKRICNKCGHVICLCH